MAALVTFALYAEKQEFSRYQTIIDRMPFGQPPPGFDPTRSPDEVSKNDYQNDAPPLSEQQAEIQKNVQFSAINLDEDGTVMVGFVDKGDPKAAKSYYLALGEESDGWLVKEADAVAKTMTISKDGVDVELKLGENSGGGGGNAKGMATRGMAAAKTNGLLGSRPAATTAATTARPLSLKGRRAQREEEQRRALEAEREKEAARAAELAARKELEEMREADRQREREEQRAQLNSIREELSRVREEKRLREEENARIEAENEAADCGIEVDI